MAYEVKYNLCDERVGNSFCDQQKGHAGEHAVTGQGEAKHTPFALEPFTRHEMVIVNADGQPIARVNNTQVGKKNGAQIVRACNSHEALLEACKLALRNEEARLYMLPASDDYEVSCQKDILSGAIGRYKAAIAKAEEKSTEKSPAE